MKKDIKTIFVIFLLSFSACIIYSSGEINLTELPDDILQLIADRSSIEDRIHLTLTSHKFDKLVLDKKFTKEDRQFVKNSPLYDRIKDYAHNRKKFSISEKSSYLFKIAQNILIEHYFFTNDNPLNCSKNNNINSYYKENFGFTDLKSEKLKDILYYCIEKNNKDQKLYLGIDCAGLHQNKIDDFTSIVDKNEKKSISAYLFNSDYANNTLTEEHNNIFLNNIIMLLKNLTELSQVKKIKIDSVLDSYCVKNYPFFYEHFSSFVTNKKIDQQSMSHKTFHIVLKSAEIIFTSLQIFSFIIINDLFKSRDTSFEDKFLKSFIILIQNNLFLKRYDYSLYNHLFHIIINTRHTFDFDRLIKALGQDNIQYYIQYCETNSGLSFKRYCEEKFSPHKKNLQFKNTRDELLKIKNKELPLRNTFVKNYCFPKILLVSDQNRYLIPSTSKYVQDHVKTVAKLNNIIKSLETEIEILKEDRKNEKCLNRQKDESIKLQNTTIENLSMRLRKSEANNKVKPTEDQLDKNQDKDVRHSNEVCGLMIKLRNLQDVISEHEHYSQINNNKELTLRKELLTLQEKLKKTEEKIDQLNNEAVQYKQKTADLETEITTLNNLDNLNTLLSNQKVALEEEAKKLTEQIEIHKTNELHLTQELLTLKKTLNETDTTIEQMKNLIDKKEDEIKTLKNGDEAKTTSINNIQNEKLELEKKLPDLKNINNKITHSKERPLLLKSIIVLLLFYSAFVTYYLYQNNTHAAAN